MRSARKISMGK